MKNIYLILFLPLFFFGSCSSVKKTSSEGPEWEVRFGNAGGFTNSRMEYVLYSNRQLKKADNTQEAQVKKLKKKTVREIKKQLDSIHLSELILNDPGNMTYFIRLKNAESDKLVQWNESTDNPEIKDLYKMLLGTIKPNK